MDGQLSHASWVFLEVVLAPSKAAATCAIYKARSCEQFIRVLPHMCMMQFTFLKSNCRCCFNQHVKTSERSVAKGKGKRRAHIPLISANIWAKESRLQVGIPPKKNEIGGRCQKNIAMQCKLQFCMKSLCKNWQHVQWIRRAFHSGVPYLYQLGQGLPGLTAPVHDVSTLLANSRCKRPEDA